MVLYVALLNTQHYKVGIKGKVEQSRERSGPSLHLGVVAIKKGSSGSHSTKVANITFFYIMIDVFVYTFYTINVATIMRLGW